MTSVTVLGLGPMGQALSGALLDANYRTTVWNRTESKADALRARGAAWAATPAEAVAASDVTLINVVDHDVGRRAGGAGGQTPSQGGVIVGSELRHPRPGAPHRQSSSRTSAAGTSTARS